MFRKKNMDKKRIELASGKVGTLHEEEENNQEFHTRNKLVKEEAHTYSEGRRAQLLHRHHLMRRTKAIQVQQET